jgi:ABC-type multidrug transport system ATPase subunit
MLARVGRPRADAVVTTRGLWRRFGSHDVLRGIDLTMYSGDRIGLCGPNGSGKTTLIRCLAGTITPTSGDVRIAGHAAGSIEARALVGVSLSQDRSFYLRLTGRENLLFFARARGYRKRQATRIVRALEEELSLEHILSQRVEQSSTGMIQQLALARALLADPPVVLLDEPTRSLDSDAAKRLWGALDRRPHAALLIATHRADDLSHCGTRVDLAAPETAGR